MTLRALVEKETLDLARDKRFGAWSLALLLFWAVALYFVFWAEAMEGPSSYPLPAMFATFAFFFVYSIGFVVLGLFLLSDGVAKEKETGILAVVGVTPVPRWQIPVAKLLAGLAAYAGAFLVACLPTTLMAYAAGATVFVLLVKLFAIPFLAAYAFLLGAGLLIGVAFPSSKVAIGTAAAVYLPLFIAFEPLVAFLAPNYPVLAKLASYAPFNVVMEASDVIAFGGVMPWAKIGILWIVGGGLAALGIWLFNRQEVAA